MNNNVFISGSISITKLPDCVKDSILKIKEQELTILVGDANGIDSMVQNYCRTINHSSVTVYSIYSTPRYCIKGFDKKYIVVQGESKRERVRQQEKDEAMTVDSEYSLVVWDGKSKGSYKNILRAIDNDKKVKIYLSSEHQFMTTEKINADEIEFIYRTNNGYTAAEVIEYLNNEGEDYFTQTRAFNKCLIDNKIITKDEGVYMPMQSYEHLFIIEKYRGKVSGIKFNNDFINWVEKWIKEIKPPEVLDLF